jgi:hypothetical protein
MNNFEIVITSILLVLFILTPRIPNSILLFIDNPIIRILLIIVPFISIGINHWLALLSVLVIGALFMERNARKMAGVNESSWWKSIDGEDIPGPLPKNISSNSITSHKTQHHTPYLPDGIDIDTCNEESPIIQADISDRPVFETLHGDLNTRGEIDSIIGRIGAAVPLNDSILSKISGLFDSIEGNDSNDVYASYA